MENLENAEINARNGHVHDDQHNIHFRIPVRCQRCRTYGDNLQQPDAWDSLAAIFYTMARKHWFLVMVPVGFFIILPMAFPFVCHQLGLYSNWIYTGIYFTIIVIVIAFVTFCCFLLRGRYLADEYSIRADCKRLSDMNEELQGLLVENP